LIVGIINSPRLLSTERREGGVYQVEEVNVRFALLERAAVMFFNSPLTGVGLAQFTPASTFKYRGRIPRAVETATPSSHNHLLGIATELGIPGIVFYLAIIIPILWRLKQLAGKLPETGIMGDNLRIVIFAIWCVYLTQNLFAEPSNNLFINAVPFLFAGLADGLYTRSLQPGLPYRSFVSQSPMRIINSHV
jgi:O-antigen ligase